MSIFYENKVYKFHSFLTERLGVGAHLHSHIEVAYLLEGESTVWIDDKKYNMLGIHIGDGEYKIEDNITFEYDEYFSVLNDMAGGNSTALFYFNTAKNDCLVITVNDKSARVVAMTYFNDYKLISKNLSGLDD